MLKYIIFRDRKYIIFNHILYLNVFIRLMILMRLTGSRIRNAEEIRQQMYADEDSSELTNDSSGNSETDNESESCRAGKLYKL